MSKKTCPYCRGSGCAHCAGKKPVRHQARMPEFRAEPARPATIGLGFVETDAGICSRGVAP